MDTLVQAVLAFFNFPLFVAFGTPTTVLEVIAFVAGAACVYGLAKQRMWNWPVAIINAGAFVFLFISVGLYADAFLQFVFIALSAYGWWYWSRGGVKDTPVAVLPVRHVSSIEIAALVPIGIAITVATAFILHRGTDSTVYWFDAFILAGSLVATYMQTRKVLESWWVWIAVDVISIPLYFYKGLTLTGILYIVFMALCIKGLYEWNNAIQNQRVAEMRATPNHPAFGGAKLV